jgi:hypothetical protein
LIKRAGISALDFNYEQRAYQRVDFLKKEFYLFIFNDLYTGRKREGFGEEGGWIRTTANKPAGIREVNKERGKTHPCLEITEKPCFSGVLPPSGLFKQGFATLQTGKKGFFAIVRMKN